MFGKIQQYEVPPKPEARTENFGGGITTRLMMKRNLDENKRNNLGFSSGACIPNSNIRLLQRNSLQDDSEDFKSSSGSQITIADVVGLLDENKDKNIATETPEQDQSPLQKMRESVRRRSRSSGRGSIVSHTKSSVSDAQKVERRVSMRTDKMSVSGIRRASPESLRESIQKSQQEVELIDVDDLASAERRNSKRSSGRVSFII
ncbi:hypothetical protein HHI36_016377 [Cryptolaemus montrouzieri]|uniref:Uncharacterized protein n=1 Tax=Cryptolaemus montrouzieri TaxID=559131 RepID=A0ABD2NJJ1_9CUCU